MQTRTGDRPPRFFDDELRVLQFLGQRGDLKDKTIATLLNWNTHPESMEDENTLLQIILHPDGEGSVLQWFPQNCEVIPML